MQNHETVLVVAAHPDDEVLGCGGTMARLAAEGQSVHVLLLADGVRSRISDLEDISDEEKLSVRSAATTVAAGVLGARSTEQFELPDNRLDRIDLLDIVHLVEKVVARVKPDLVITHHHGDVNVDHRITHEAVLAACRPQPGFVVTNILCFEVPSSTEWRPPASGIPFVPNWFVDISATLSRKLEALQAYDTEMRPFPHPRSYMGVEALARWRGATVGVEAAEAFVLARRIVR